MTKVLVYGCNGFMGHVICDLIKDMDQIEVAAGVDVTVPEGTPFPVYTSLKDVDTDIDVIIDFSAAAAVDAVLDFAAEKKVPLVECTTGLSPEQLSHLEDVSRKVAVLRSANMSLGINTLMKLIKDAARILSQAGFDIDIVERHHRRKLDAPSGTALALADSVNEVLEGSYTYTYDRSQRRMQRPVKEIGISAVRGGTIVGDHEVIFAGTDEVIELKHSAYSRAVFGKGAIQAAIYLADKPAGLYDMGDVIGQL
ncbi:MAG: 4-hydroxy-tetrahydrodipicolinate reductase [Eubacterium sp.]|nr:4-hydroxy-tetrahydrodipicolinate reductase [Eubacterium sp.]